VDEVEVLALVELLDVLLELESLLESPEDT